MSLSLHSMRLFPKLGGAAAYRITGLAARCDWVVLSDTRPPHVHLHRNAATDRPRHIFLSLRAPFAALACFADRILPTLNDGFVLVSGSEDVTVPQQTDKRWRSFNAQERSSIRRILQHPHLRHWFAENLDDDSHPLMSPLPLGMVFPHGDFGADVTGRLTPPLSDRPLRVLCAHRVREGPQWETRRRVTQIAKTAWPHFCTVLQEDVPEPEFLDLVERHAFVLCVEGGGLDPSPKAWQTIIHGAVPIIRDSPLRAAYRNLPVAFIPDWGAQHLSLARLAEWRGRFAPRHASWVARAQILHRLGLDYWWGRVSAMAPDREAHAPDMPATLAFTTTADSSAHTTPGTCVGA